MAADRTEKILLQLQLDASQLIANIQKAKDAVELTNKQIASARFELSELEKKGITSGASYDNLSEKIIQYESKLALVKNQQRDYEKQLRLSTAANEAQQGSLDQQKALLSVLTSQFDALSKEERESSDVGKQLAADILTITNNLKGQEQAVGNSRRNVGNYAAAIKEAFTAVNVAKSGVNDTKLAIEQLNVKFKEGSISEQEYNQELGILVSQLAENENSVSNLSQKLEELKGIVTENGEGFKSLRQRLREARDEATLMQDKFSAGLISEKELIAAQQRVANLTEEMDDFNKRVEALNPEAKFKAFTQAAAGLSGVVNIASSGMGLLGEQSEDAAQALLKVQQFMQFTAGLNQLAGLADSFQNIRVVLGLTTAATNQQTAAQVRNTISTEANAVANIELAAAEGVAATATRGLGAAMSTLAGPLAIIGLVAAGVIASLSAFGESGFQEASFDIKQSVEEENAAHERTLKLLSDVTRGRVIDADAALKQAKAQQAVKLAQATSDTEKEEIVKDTRPEIQRLEDDLIQIKREALAEELRLIEQHELITSQKLLTAQTERIFAKGEEAQKIADQAVEAAEKELEQTRNRNSELLAEQEKFEKEVALIPRQRQEQIIQAENKFSERRKAALNQASLIRISLIKDLQVREIEQEKESSRQKIEKLLEDEKANAELILAEKQATQEKIIQIQRRFQLEEIKERNALDIASTFEGTEARIEAEITASERINSFQQQNETITQSQRLLIEKETIEKIGSLKDELIQQDLEVSNRQIETVRATQDAILAVKRAQARTPEERASVDVEQIQSDLALELKLIEETNDKKVASLENQKQTELALLRSGTDAQTRETEDFKNKEKEIITRIDGEINDVNQASDAKALQLVVESGEDQLQALTEIGDAKINAFVNLKQQELAAAAPENQVAAQLELLNAQEEAELASFQRRLDAGEAFAEEGNAIKRKFAKAEMDLNRQVELHKLSLMADAFGQGAALFKKHTVAYRVMASAQALINTYVAATQAYYTGLQAGFPVGLILGPVMAGLAIASGLSNVAQINGVQFYEGGYTGDGNPKEESKAVGKRPYIYHKGEYIIPHKTLQDPVVADLVQSVIEPKRRLNISSTHLLESMAMPVKLPKFEVGGYTPSLIVTQTNQGAAFNAEEFSTRVTDSLLTAMREMPAPVVAVQDINSAQGTLTKVESRANI